MGCEIGISVLSPPLNHHTPLTEQGPKLHIPLEKVRPTARGLKGNPFKTCFKTTESDIERMQRESETQTERERERDIYIYKYID